MRSTVRGAFVPIPEGWFLMGSDEGQDDEKPVHRVWVDAFELAVYPVTEAQYASFLDGTGHEAPREWSPSAYVPDLPVIGVSWVDAQAYCAWRTRGGTAMALVRLPRRASRRPGRRRSPRRPRHRSPPLLSPLRRLGGRTSW